MYLGRSTSCNILLRLIRLILLVGLYISGCSMTVFSIQLTTSNGDSCPTACMCINSTDSSRRLGYSVNCSGQNFFAVPVKLPLNVTNLYLSNNNLTELSDQDMDGYNLIRVLDLSFNRISRLSRDSLSSLAMLEELYLNDNSLTMTLDSVPYATFDKLVSLAVLSLHNNNVSNISYYWDDHSICINSYRDDLYSTLTSLQTLKIDGACIDIQLGNGFKQLQSLTTLGIYGRLCFVTNTTFENLAGLPIDELIIKTGSNLTSLEPDSFTHFSNMTVLDLGLNRELMTTVLNATAWYGLRNTKIKKLVLTRVASDIMYNVVVTEKFFQYLNETKIETLLLNKNNIGVFSPGISKYLPYLKHWDMSWNRLSLVGSLTDEFRLMKEVVYIDVSQQKQRYEGSAKRDLKRFEMAERQNKLEDSRRYPRSTPMPQAEQCRRKVSPEIKTCPDLPSELNPPSPLQPGDPWCIYFPPKMETFNLSASLSVNLLGNVLPQISAFGSISLKETVYSSNGIQFLTGPIIFYNPNPNVSYTLDLRDNGIQCIYEDVLQLSVLKGLKLTNLYLSNNNLRTQLEEDTAGNLFAQYKDIAELRLDSNQIRTLPPAAFRNLANLVTLDLSYNALQSVSFEFKHMTRLSFLDLSNNLFTNIDDNTLANLFVLIKISNLSLNLNGNQISCSCQTLNLLIWMRANAERIIQYDQYSCIYKNSTIKLSQVLSTDLMNVCETTFTGMAIGVAVGGMVIVLAIISVIIAVLIHRKSSRTTDSSCDNSRRGVEHRELDRVHNGIFCTEDFLANEICSKPDIEYKDAFVICAHQDDEWVSLLEENLGKFSGDTSTLDKTELRFNFCTHKYDFLAGKPITENVDMAIRSTRKKILVLSKHFLQSNWCDYEFKRALHLDISSGTNSIIPVVIDSLTDIRDKMPADLKDICCRTTYLEWPRCNEDCAAQAVFWRKLSDALVMR